MSTVDLLTEDLLSLAQATREIPTRPNVSTVWRWAKRGIRGVRLETVKVGGKQMTSVQALTRFLQATNRKEVAS
ncbi:MAG: DUF1580 domain-containing protein [Planctomycetota bacterium]